MTARIVNACMVCALALALGVLGCEKTETGGEEMAAKGTEMKAAAYTAIANMGATNGNSAHGTVTFTKVEEGVRVVAHFEGVPAGDHGFHIHEFGDCSSGDGKSAGGHFNPYSVPHAGPDGEQRHVGDLGNITANADGVAEKEFVDAMLGFEGERSIAGKGVILHANADDLTTQPTGAAGARISCGVIELAAEPVSEK